MDITLSATKSQTRWRHFLVWSSSAALMFPLVVLLHEFAQVKIICARLGLRPNRGQFDETD